MRVLVTGGAGFIGSHLALRLAADDHAVTVLDSLSAQIHGADPEHTSPLLTQLAGRVRVVHGSVCDVDVLGECIRDQDAVVHLAAETGTGQSMYEIRRYSDVNIGGTALLLDLLANREHDVRRVVVASSRAIHGEGKYRDPDGNIVYPGPRHIDDMSAGLFDPMCARTGRPLEMLPTDEDSKIHPSSVYGITKQNQEQMVMTVCSAIGIEPVSLRYQNVYGPGQSLTNPYTGILSIFSTRLRNGSPLNIFEDGKESRDFVYIDDVVEATCRALTKPEAAGEAFAIGSGVGTDVLTVARSLAASYGVDAEIMVSGAFRVGDIRHNVADLSKARRLLGFDSTVEFADGIDRFSHWVAQQDVAEDAYDRSIRELTEKGLYRS